MARFEISTSIGDPIHGDGWATGFGGADGGQRHVKIDLGRDQIDILVYGDDETRQLMKALASASGGLLATLPDEPGPLDERDESAVAVEQERWPSVAEVAGEVHGGEAHSDCCGEPVPVDPRGRTDHCEVMPKGHRGRHDSWWMQWPNDSEGAANGGVSCGYSGCTPDDPCGACQTLAGAQGGER